MGSSKTTYSPTTRSLAGGPTVESSILARAIPPLWSVRTSLPRARELPAPRFVIVIGANGAGKSTWCRAHQEELPSNFYDADSIAQGLGSYDDSARQLEARALVDAHIDQHLEQNDSFGFESTYSGASRPRIARAGERTRLRDLRYFCRHPRPVHQHRPRGSARKSSNWPPRSPIGDPAPVDCGAGELGQDRFPVRSHPDPRQFRRPRLDCRRLRRPRPAPPRR